MSDHATKAFDVVARATSRRGFLGRIARAAGGAALVLGAVAAGNASAARGAKTCCVYWCFDWGGGGGEYLLAKCSNNGRCRERFKGCEFLYSEQVNDCSQC